MVHIPAMKKVKGKWFWVGENGVFFLWLLEID
jgi:hypothetical protein